MKIVSITRARELCGIERYARELAHALRTLGHVVREDDAPSGYSTIHDLSTDAVIVHTEIGEDLRSGDALKLLFALARARPRVRRIAIYVHSVFEPNDLQMRFSFLRRVACIAQHVVYGLFAQRAVLITTTRISFERLAEKNISARHIPLGMYRAPGERARSRTFFSTHWPQAIGKVVIAVVGHPYASKRFDLAVATFAQMPVDIRRRSLLAFVGGDHRLDPASWSAIERELRTLNAAEYVVTGVLSDADFDSALDAIDIALLPYHGRSSASAVVSALASRPVALVTSHDPTFDDLTSAGAAERASTWPEQSAPICAFLVSTPERRRELALGLEKFARSISIDAVARKLVDAIA